MDDNVATQKFAMEWRKYLSKMWEMKLGTPELEPLKRLAKALALQDVGATEGEGIIYEPTYQHDHPAMVRRVFGRVYISSWYLLNSVPLWVLYIEPARRLLEAQKKLNAEV